MTTTTEPDVPAPAPRAKFRTRIAERLPEILIEALFVLIAVLLAFLVEEWREGRELDRIAQEARRAIVKEVEHNRAEILESRQAAIDAIAALEAGLATEPGAPALHELKISFELALLSSAAWRAAQSMEAARRMDYAWMLKVSQAYELQAMYQQAQWAAVDALVAFRAASDEAVLVSSARTLLARMRQVSGFNQALEEDYVGVL